MARLTLTIGSDLASVPLLAVAIHGISLHAGLPEAGASDVELCLVEALTNVIRHAYRLEADRPVEVVVAIEDSRLQLNVYDNGASMGSEQLNMLIRGEEIATPDAEDRASLREGGRGLQIMHDLMDEIDYARDGERNRLTLTKYLRA